VQMIIARRMLTLGWYLHVDTHWESPIG
jgi:hypothetical protein